MHRVGRGPRAPGVVLGFPVRTSGQAKVEHPKHVSMQSIPNNRDVLAEGWVAIDLIHQMNTARFN